MVSFEDEEITTLTQPESIDKKEHLALRLVLFISLYILLNYFILSEVYSFFGFEKNFLFTLFLVLLSFSYVLGAAALRVSDNFLAKFVNVIGSLWLGIMVFASFSFLLVEFLLFFDVISFNVRPLFAFSLVLVLTIYSVINAMFTLTRKFKISSSKVSSPLRVVQISDLHVGAAHKKTFLEKIVKRVNEEKPDFVVITGDLIDGKHKYVSGYFDILKNVKCKVFMITGNHERMTGMDTVDSLLKDSGVIMLRDTVVKFGELNIIGIDDFEKPSRMIRTLRNLKFSSSRFNLLLYHRPDRFKEASKLGVDLMLAGHTHAGQIFPINLLLKFFYKKVKGLKRRGDSYLYVSPGTGWWGPPKRLGSKNEVTVFDITPIDMRG
jgi:predicted MPP superfamily phosphohydrolase